MRLWAAAVVAAAGLAALLFFEPAVDRLTNLVENESAYLSALVAVIALGVAMVALSVAAWATRKAYSLRSDIAQLSRSLDGALHEIDARSSKHARTIGEINDALKSDVSFVPERQAHAPPSPEARPEAGQTEPPPHGANVIPHPSSRAAHEPKAPPTNDAFAEADGSQMEAAIAQVSGRDGPELSLQPIVSVSESVARGFEVFAHLRLSDERFADVRRLASTPDDMNVAGFERGIILAAAKAARQQLGDEATNMPLHCAISSRLLDDQEELSLVAELFDVHPALTRSLILSVPAHLFQSDGSGRLAMLETLSEVGIRFAIEDWHGTATEAADLRNAGVAYIKQPTKRLLGLEKLRGKALSAEMLVEAAAEAELQIIATDVNVDQEAISLIDSGIDLLSGERFGAPKRLRESPGDDSDKVVRI